MTDYGRRALETIIPRLVFEKKTIVSGFMYGVDQYAHELCLENGGHTIAVLGWGINEPLEGANKKLAGAIIAGGGLVLSEWENQPPTLWTFPIRNRIVAGLSTDVIVVEAALKSGSLITARIAHELQRTVWAVPGSITSPVSAGTNHLIAGGMAKAWLGELPQEDVKESDPLLAALGEEGKSANDLARTLRVPVSQVGAQLSLLALAGQVVERSGKFLRVHAYKN